MSAWDFQSQKEIDCRLIRDALFYIFTVVLYLPPQIWKIPHQWEVGGEGRNNIKIIDNWLQVLNCIVFQTVWTISFSLVRTDSNLHTNFFKILPTFQTGLGKTLFDKWEYYDNWNDLTKDII